MYEDEVENFRKYLASERLREKSITSYLRSLRKFIELIKKNPRKLDKDDIKTWKTYCLKYHNNSLTPKYCAINKYLEYLYDEELIDKSTMDKLKLIPPQWKQSIKQPLTRKEIKSLLEIAKKRSFRDYTIFSISYSAMLRRSELLDIKIDHVDTEKNQIKILDGKGGKDAIVQISQECSDALRTYIDNYREKPKKGHEQYLFLNNGKRLYKNKIHAIYSEYKLIMRWDKKDFYPHIMRHTGITHYAEVEKDIAILQKQTRHKDIDTLIKTYVHKTEDELKQAYNKAFNNYDQETPKKPDPVEVKPKPVEPTIKPPTPQPQPQIQQQEPNKQILKDQLLQRLARGEISQDVYLIALKQLENNTSDDLNYYG